MSIGEKIAYYRKKAEMSQEELGNQLFVTRQTVSQWENDQTIPTVENFMRLCEIFKLTMNDFIEQNVVAAQKDSPEAEERYVFDYTDSQVEQAYKVLFNKTFRNTLIFQIVFTALLLLLTIKIGRHQVIPAVYLIFYVINLIRGWFDFKAKCKKHKERNIGQYVFEVKGGGLYFLKYSHAGELVYYEHISVAEIEKTWETSEMYLFQFKQRRYIIIKENIGAESKLRQLLGF